MNTTMADGASERLDAQIADALFGQPAMSKMDVANRLRQLRGDGAALLGSAAYPAAWMWPHPENGGVRFTADADVATEAANVGRAVSALYRVPVQEYAQSSSAGHGDAPWPEIDMNLADAYSAGAEGLEFEGIARRAAVRAAVAAIAARQPVGQISNAEIDARLNALYREMVDGGQHNGGMSGVAWDRAVYRMAANQPAQPVDLGPVREALQAAARSLRTIADSTKETELLETARDIRAYAGSRANCAERALSELKEAGGE